MRINLERKSGQIHKDIGTFVGNSGVRECNATNAFPAVGEHDKHKLPNGNGVGMACQKLLESRDSMVFESKDDAFKFYKEYAVSVGFSAIIKASRRSRISGKFIDAKFVCTRYGSKRDSNLSGCSELTYAAPSTSIPLKKKRGRINRSSSKTDCKACMHVKKMQDGSWIINSFVKEHNHDLVPNHVGFQIRDIHSRDAYALNTVRNRKKKPSVPLSKQSGQMQKTEDHENATSISSSSCLGLQKGDTQVMIEYFSHEQDENPHFFYAIDLNREKQLKNVMWVDGKGRIDYCRFGDVVFFDTTYRNNEFKLQFAPFIGMNNHFQSLLLGCALVADDSKSTYVWLLRAWLRSMHGQVPKVVLTDEDQMLKEAIAEVLPSTRHCFGLWLILDKVKEKLSYVVSKHDSFIKKFNKCVLKSQSEAQFEKRWMKLMERFELRNDPWLQSLYSDRLRWVPVFMKDVFLAGLSPAERLNSISSPLGKCLLRKTNLKEFFQNYSTMLQEKCEDESKAEFDTCHKQPGLKSPSLYEKQMSTIYTNAVFRKFQIEVLGVVACHPKLEHEYGATKNFKVQDFNDNQTYQVIWNEETSDTSCTCRFFEYNGLLCRHVLIVFQISGVSKIPEKCILKRWTMDAKNGETLKQVGSMMSNNHRFNDLCQRALKLGDVGSLCQESYNIAFAGLENALRKCEGVNYSVQTIPDGLHEFEEVAQYECTGKELLNSIAASSNDCNSSQLHVQGLNQQFKTTERW